MFRAILVLGLKTLSRSYLLIINKSQGLIWLAVSALRKLSRQGPLNTAGKALVFLEKIVGPVWKVSSAQVWVDPGVKVDIQVLLFCVVNLPSLQALTTRLGLGFHIRLPVTRLYSSPNYASVLCHKNSKWGWVCGEEGIDWKWPTPAGAFDLDLAKKWHHPPLISLKLVPDIINHSTLFQLNWDSGTATHVHHDSMFLWSIPALDKTHPKQLENFTRQFLINFSIVGPPWNQRNSKRKTERLLGVKEENLVSSTQLFKRLSSMFKSGPDQEARVDHYSFKYQTHRTASHIGQTGTCLRCHTGSIHFRESQIIGQNTKGMWFLETTGYTFGVNWVRLSPPPDWVTLSKSASLGSFSSLKPFTAFFCAPRGHGPVPQGLLIFCHVFNNEEQNIFLNIHSNASQISIPGMSEKGLFCNCFILFLNFINFLDPEEGAVGWKPNTKFSSIFDSCLVFLCLQTLLQWMWPFFIKNLIFKMSTVLLLLKQKSFRVTRRIRDLQSAWHHHTVWA